MKNPKITEVGNQFGIKYDEYVWHKTWHSFKRVFFKDWNGDKLLFPSYILAAQWVVARQGLDFNG